jgi:hypothetical protein
MLFQLRRKVHVGHSETRMNQVALFIDSLNLEYERGYDRFDGGYWFIIGKPFSK